jgi:hypothetical protein
MGPSHHLHCCGRIMVANFGEQEIEGGRYLARDLVSLGRKRHGGSFWGVKRALRRHATDIKRG